MCIQSARHGLVALDDSYMFRLIYWIVNTCNECAGYELVLIQSLGELLCPQGPLCPQVRTGGSRIPTRTVFPARFGIFWKIRDNVLDQGQCPRSGTMSSIRDRDLAPHGPLCPQGPLLCTQDPLLCPQGPLLSGVRLLQTNVVGWSGTNLHHRIAGFDDIILQTNVVGWSGTNLHLQTNVVGW